MEELEKMDEIQYLANWTLNQYKANGNMGEYTCYDYMSRLGCNFVNLEFEKVPVPNKDLIDGEWRGNQ